MANTSNSDSGAAKNVGNFRKLVSHVESMGARYQPSNPNLLVSVMNASLTRATAAVTPYADAKTAKQTAVFDQQQYFSGTGKLLSQVMRYLKSCGASPVSIEMGAALVRKYRGYIPKAKQEDQQETPPADGGTEPPAEDNGTNGNGNGRSNRQTSYDFLIQHFRDFISVVRNEDAYTPNEDHLKVATLETRLAEMEAAVGAAYAAKRAFSEAQKELWEAHDHPETGVATLASKTKLYLSSLGGLKNPDYKAVSVLGFKALHK